eukprot:1057825-Amphidinium_carterae.2
MGAVHLARDDCGSTSMRGDKSCKRQGVLRRGLPPSWDKHSAGTSCYLAHNCIAEGSPYAVERGVQHP